MEKEIENLLAQLQQDKSLKVWSLIITFFGDVVLARGGNVSAKSVQQLLGAMGVGAGAVRTALSRLASDGWIERQKLGRESYYELTSEGCELSHRAAARIYAPVPDPDHAERDCGQWRIAIAKPGAGFANTLESEPQENLIEVAANCRLYFTSNESEAVDDDCLVIDGDLRQVPFWITEVLVPESVKLGYHSILKRFSMIGEPDKLSPLNCLVLRCLLVHEWRRQLLRTTVVPIPLQSLQLPEHECRQFVAARYRQLLAGSELWLDEHATCMNGSLPASTDAVATRFTAEFRTT